MIKSGKELPDGGAHRNIVAGHPVQSVTKIGGTVTGGHGDWEEGIYKFISPGIGLTMGIGKERDICADLFPNQIYTVLDIGKRSTSTSTPTWATSL